MSNTSRLEQTIYNDYKHTQAHVPDMLAVALKSRRLKVMVAEAIWIEMKAN